MNARNCILGVNALQHFSLYIYVCAFLYIPKISLFRMIINYQSLYKYIW